MFSFIILLAMGIISINSCKKESLFSSKQHSAIENTSVSNDAAAKESSGNITVSGGGSFDELGAITTYTFNAVQHKDGSTNGHLMLHFRAAESSMQVSIDCLRLFGDNKATMCGVITKLYGKENMGFPPPPFIFVGGRVSFTVQDNGEGGSASPDLVSDIGELIPGVPASCADEWPLYLAGANVQITK